MTDDIYFTTENSKVCPISGETSEEERINYFTHLIGLFLSLIGGGILVWAGLSGDIWNITSCCVYIVTLVASYAASSCYHRCDFVLRKKALKIVDHSCIYLFIAGTYTPFTLGPLRNFHGWELFFIVWGIAIFGIVFKIVAIDRFNGLSLFSYLLMGWLVTFSFPTLVEELSLSTLLWLISGGLAYTFGTLFYIWETLPFNHAIWHLFVLGGSFCHYCAIWDLTVA
jgi:hemolysin III